MFFFKKGTDTVHAYFPSDVWYEFPSGIQVSSVGLFVDLPAPITKINVHIRGGFIIPMQIPGENLVIGRDNPFTLLVAQSNSGTAYGNLYWDDGESMEMNSYNYFEFSLVNSQLTIHSLVANYKDESMRLEIIKILGIKNPVQNVTVNGKIYSNFLYNIPDQVYIHTLKKMFSLFKNIIFIFFS